MTFREFLNLCDNYNPNTEFVIYNKNTGLLLGQKEGSFSKEQSNCHPQATWTVI